MNTPIYDFLRNYSEKNPLRCHMPGHHGKHISEELAELYRRDIMVISGADSLFEA